MAATALLLGVFAVLASPAQAAGTYVVDTTADDGDSAPGDGVCLTAAGGCTLRAAIQESNRDAQPSFINFGIPGTGPHTIQLTSHLPNNNDRSGGTTIDGYTQPGSSPNTAADGSNAVLMVQIRGTGFGNGQDAIVFASGNNLVRGLAIFNVRLGVTMIGADSIGNTVVGNFLGTDAGATFGATTRDSSAVTVMVRTGASRNQIGRPGLADRNVIAGGPSNGIVIGAIAAGEPVTPGNFVQNNVIGLSPSGGALPNRAHGIDINLGGSRNLVGGLEPGMRNVLSGNDGAGIEVSHGSQTAGNQVVGNRVGTNLLGTASPDHVRNGQADVHVEDLVRDTLVAYNTIGSAPRLIRSDGGLRIDNTAGTRVEHNRIGVSENGTPIPTGPYGIAVENGASDTIIGPGNVLANNPVGIRVTGDATRGLTITQNSISNHTGLGIDIDPVGSVNPNDPGDADTGPNGRLNHPVLTAGGNTLVRGTACGGCRIEVFEADGTSTDPGLPVSFGEGQTLLGTNVAAGDGTFEVTIPASEDDRTVTATATDGGGNTSEFALNLLVEGDDEPPPAPTEFVKDTFGRTATNGWGEAEIGGPWTPVAFARSFSVNGGLGRIETPAGRIRRIELRDAAVTDADMKMTVSTNRTPFMGSHQIGFLVRRVDNATNYEARIRYAPNGNLYVGIERSNTWLGEASLGPAPPPGTPITLRAEVVGVSPTRIRAKAWIASTTEPEAWAITVNDNTSELQRSGTVGVLSSSNELFGSEPVLVTVDNLTGVAPK